MVVVSELTSIFWGVALEGSNKKYSQTTERPVHISMAALDPFQTHDENPVSLMIEHDGKSYVLCTLQHGQQFQQPLDLEFASGEELTFFIKGKGVIYLSGYVMPEDETPWPNDVTTDSDEEEELESDEDISPLPGRKKRQKSDKETKKSSKKAKLTIEDIDEADDDDDTDAEFIDDEAEEASEEEDEDDEEEDEDSNLEAELLRYLGDDDESNDSDDEMDTKKAVTVDRKPNVGKKDKKNVASGVADVKAKPVAQTGAEKVGVPVSTTPTTQSSSADTSNTSQVAEGKKKRKKKKKNKNAAEKQQQNNGLRG